MTFPLYLICKRKVVYKVFFWDYISSLGRWSCCILALNQQWYTYFLFLTKLLFPADVTHVVMFILFPLTRWQGNWKVRKRLASWSWVHYITPCNSHCCLVKVSTPAMWPLTSEVPWRTPHIQQQILWRSPQTRYETQKVCITGSGHTIRCCYITLNILQTTVKPVYNDHLMGSFFAFWSSSGWPRAT